MTLKLNLKLLKYQFKIIIIISYEKTNIFNINYKEKFNINKLNKKTHMLTFDSI